MDTGMRNTLDQSFRQLINSVRRKNSSVTTIQWSVHPDSAVKALGQRLGSDDARQLGLAEGGRILTHSGTNIFRLLGERTFYGSRLLPLQEINIWWSSIKTFSNAKRDWYEEKLFKFKFPIFNLFPRRVQLCGSGRPDGGESDLPRRMSTPRSPRLDPLLTVGSLQKYLERE